MATKYLDSTGLAYFWSKIKAYGNAHWGGGGGSGTSVPTVNTLAEFDSTAHMNSTDMTASEVSDFVDSLDAQGANLADYVVEQGTDGIWKYRKWASGIAECWGVWSGTLTNYTTTMGGNAYYTAISFPTGLFNSAPIPQYSANIGGSFTLTGTLTDSLTKDSCNYYALSNSNGSKASSFRIYAIGTWK